MGKRLEGGIYVNIISITSTGSFWTWNHRVYIYMYIHVHGGYERSAVERYARKAEVVGKQHQCRADKTNSKHVAGAEGIYIK